MILKRSEPDLPTVLDLLKNRDEAFLEQTFRDTSPFLLKILAMNGIYSDVAEDLVSQTWERFFTNLDKFEARSELRTFICGILLNKIREHRRASGRMLFEEDAEAVMARSFSSEGWWNVDWPSPDAIVYSSQLSVLIGDCLDGLTDLQKSAFLLKEVDQEESSEVCNVLGISISHLRVLIFRAKDKLRQCLEGQVDG